jgi:hypothetical protein
MGRLEITRWPRVLHNPLLPNGFNAEAIVRIDPGAAARDGCLRGDRPGQDAVAGTVEGEATAAPPSPEPASEPTRMDNMVTFWSAAITEWSGRPRDWD